MNKSNILLSRNALLGYIITLLVFSNFFHHIDYSYTVANNGGKYLISAQQLVNSEKIETVSYYHSRFVYPLLLALSFKIGGVNLDSAHLMTQFIFILTICVLFWTATTLFGKWVAFFSSILILSTPTFFIIGRTIDLNFLDTLFILSSCTIFNTGWVKKQNIYFWISGLFMALACFTRETAWFFVIYPIVYFIVLPDTRNKIFLKNCLSYYTSILIVILIGAFYLTTLGESYWQVFGAMQPGGLARISVNNTISNNFLQYILKGFIALISHPWEKISLFPAMLISWGIISWSSFKRKSKKDRSLLAIMLPTLPLVFLYGTTYPYINERHIILFFLLSHVSLFRSLQLIFSSYKYKIYIKPLIHNKRNMPQGYKNKFRRLLLIIFPIFAIGIVQLSQIQNTLLKKIKKIRIGMSLIPGGRFSQDSKDVAHWINNNIPKNSILCVGGYYDQAISFFTDLNYEYRTYGNQPEETLMIKLIDEESLPSDFEIVSIRTNHKFRSPAFQYRRLIYVTTKKDITNYLNSLSKENQWIVYFKSENNNLDNYLNQITELRTDKVFENPFSIIYKTNSELKYNNTYNLVNKIGNSKEDFIWLKKFYPKEYNDYRKFLQKYGFKFKNI